MKIEEAMAEGHKLLETPDETTEEFIDPNKPHKFVPDEHYTWACKICGCSKDGSYLHLPLEKDE